MTSYDVRFSSLDPRLLVSAEAAGLFNLPRFQTDFPWLYTAIPYSNHTGQFSWFTGSIGVIAFPVTWGCFLSGRLFRRENREMTAVIWGGILMGMVVLFLNFCYGGVSTRYMSDALPSFTAIGGLLLLKGQEKKESDGEHTQRNWGIPILLCLLTLVTAFCLAAEELRLYVPDKYLYLERMLSFR